MTTSVDGSIPYSLYYHFLDLTGGDLWGAGKGTDYFDLYNKDSTLMQNLLKSFPPYAVGGGSKINVLDPTQYPIEQLTDRDQQDALNTASNAWFYGTDKAITMAAMNDKLLGFLPWNAKVVKDVNGTEVYMHRYGSNDPKDIRYFDPLVGAPLYMKLQTFAYIGGAGLLTYFGWKELRRKNII